MRVSLRLGLAAWLCAAAAAETNIEFGGGGLAAWDVLDFHGDGVVQEAVDHTAPPGHGPAVLRIEGTHLLMLAQGARMAGGTIVLLYRELSPADQDADGVLAFGAAYPDDIEEMHNTKEVRPHTWVEMDNDTGLHIRSNLGGEREDVLAQEPGLGLVTGAWNKTGWIWQKVRLGDGRARVKYWPAHEKEPAEWALEAPWDRAAPERIGVRISSGAVHLAYFASGAADLPITEPKAWLCSMTDKVPGPANLTLNLYLHDPPASAVPLRLRVYRDGALQATYEGERTFIGNPVTMNVGRWAARMTGEPLLPADAAPGPYLVRLESEAAGIDASARFELLSTERIEAEMDAAAAAAQALAEDASPRVRAYARSAADLVAQAREDLAGGDVEGAERVLGYALEPLRHLAALGACAWPAELAEQREAPPAPPAREDGRREVFRTGMACRVASVDLHGAGSLVAGRTYPVRVAVEGVPPLDAPVACTLLLRSPLGGRTVASDSVTLPPGAAGDHHLEFTLALPRPEDALLEPRPNILDEPHHLLFIMRDAESGAHLILDNPPGEHADFPGQHYLLREVYVSTLWPELGALSPAEGAIGVPLRIETAVRHEGAPVQAEVILSLFAPGEARLLHREVQTVTVFPQQIMNLAFDWTPDVSGELVRTVEVRDDARLITRAEDTLRIAPPAPVRIVRANTCEPAGGTAWTTAVTVSSEGTAPRAVRVHAGDVLAGEAAGAPGETVVRCRPHFGYYDVEADFGAWRHVARLVAAVGEVRGGELLLNGEPFIIKGLNVHGMDGASPARTRAMLRIFRERGFNTMRGDFPPPWQMDMAIEENLGYTALAPFSCCSTTDIFARQDGPPMTTAQAITERFIERYRDEGGVLYWNSCNEVVGDITPFLRALYPLYKELDPYGRPVHYANLYGQDRWQGQDFMSVNYYFSAREEPAHRHPNILQSLEIARAHGLPLTYCEFNSWHGAVIPSGVDALHNLFDWGIARGMQGGFFYFRFNSERHPGIIDDAYNTHQRMNEALDTVFADAQVTLLQAAPDGVRLRVRNKRAFTLRDVVLVAGVGGGRTCTVPLGELPPGAETIAEIPLETPAPGNGLFIEGELRFTTHYAFHERVPVAIAAE